MDVESGLVRLSAWVFFVDHGEHIGVHHTVKGTVWMAPRPVAQKLEDFAAFRPLTPDTREWFERGVLVRPFTEPLFAPSQTAEEADLGSRWNAWYWRREVEAEREYRWQGEVVLKMPEDLFLYQELIHGRRVRSVLEIGSGYGGGLWFFGTILAMNSGGHVVGVDIDPPSREPDYSRCSGVVVGTVRGDAHLTSTVDRVRALRSAFDLIVIDADPTPDGKLRLLERWSALLAPQGVIAVEDLGSPACVQAANLIEHQIDALLLQHPDLGIYWPACRFAVNKTARGIFQRR